MNVWLEQYFGLGAKHYNFCGIIFIGITPGVHVTVILQNAAVVGKLLPSLFSPTSSVETVFNPSIYSIQIISYMAGLYPIDSSYYQSFYVLKAYVHKWWNFFC